MAMDINELSTEALIGQLFLEVGNPEEDDKSDPTDLEEQDMRYRQAMEMFLSRVPASSSVEAHPDMPLLTDVAKLVIKCQNGLRLAFFRGISDMALGPEQTHWGVIQRAYVAYLQWVLHGRIISDLPGATGANVAASQPQPSQGPGMCTHCRRRPVILICERGCALKFGSSTTISTGYCCADCRRLHRPVHDSICSQRGNFIRSVYFMMKSIYAVGRKTAALVPKTFEEKQGITILTEKHRYADALVGKHLLGDFNQDPFHSTRHTSMAFYDDYAPDVGYMLSPLKEWLWTGKLNRRRATSPNVPY